MEKNTMCLKKVVAFAVCFFAAAWLMPSPGLAQVVGGDVGTGDVGDGGLGGGGVVDPPGPVWEFFRFPLESKNENMLVVFERLREMLSGFFDISHTPRACPPTSSRPTE